MYAPEQATFGLTCAPTPKTYFKPAHEILVLNVKSGDFGHQVNSDIHLQTVEIQMRRLLMSLLTALNEPSHQDHHYFLS